MQRGRGRTDEEGRKYKWELKRKDIWQIETRFRFALVFERGGPANY
jgi:hypothetical protein